MESWKPRDWLGAGKEAVGKEGRPGRPGRPGIGQRRPSWPARQKERGRAREIRSARAAVWRSSSQGKPQDIQRGEVNYPQVTHNAISDVLNNSGENQPAARECHLFHKLFTNHQPAPAQTDNNNIIQYMSCIIYNGENGRAIRWFVGRITLAGMLREAKELPFWEGSSTIRGHRDAALF